MFYDVCACGGFKKSARTDDFGIRNWMGLRYLTLGLGHRKKRMLFGRRICAKMHWKEQKQPAKKSESESDEESAKEQSVSDFMALLCTIWTYLIYYLMLFFLWYFVRWKADVWLTCHRLRSQVLSAGLLRTDGLKQVGLGRTTCPEARTCPRLPPWEHLFYFVLE